MYTVHSGITFYGNEKVQIIDWGNSAECGAFTSRKGDREKYTFQAKLNFYGRLVKYLPNETSFGVQPQITVLRDKSPYPLRVFTRADTNLNQRRRIPNSYYFYIDDRPNKILKSDHFGTESTLLTNFSSQRFNISESLISDGVISEGDRSRPEGALRSEGGDDTTPMNKWKAARDAEHENLIKISIKKLETDSSVYILNTDSRIVYLTYLVDVLLFFSPNIEHIRYVYNKLSECYSMTFESPFHRKSLSFTAEEESLLPTSDKSKFQQSFVRVSRSMSRIALDQIFSRRIRNSHSM